MSILLVGIVIFTISVFVIELSFYAYRTYRNPNRGKIRKRLRSFSHIKSGDEDSDILRKRVLSDVPFLNTLLLKMPGVQSLDRLIQQANVPYPLGFFILLTLVLALTGYFGSSLMLTNKYLPYLVMILLAGLPTIYLSQKKRERLEKFQRQLPEGLELIARALKAGHAFTSGMKLAADEFDDPLGPEFEETLDGINFGVSVPDALRGLAERIDCHELRFFVVSVILQRETGGNLAEIIENLALLIRERFKLQGKIRVLSAEGRLSAVILVALPLCVMLAIHILNPKYIHTLFTETAGQVAMGIAASLMVTGIIVIKNMIKIKV